MRSFWTVHSLHCSFLCSLLCCRLNFINILKICHLDHIINSVNQNHRIQTETQMRVIVYRSCAVIVIIKATLMLIDMQQNVMEAECSINKNCQHFPVTNIPWILTQVVPSKTCFSLNKPIGAIILLDRQSTSFMKSIIKNYMNEFIFAVAHC